MKVLIAIFLFMPLLSQALEVTASPDKTELAVNESFVFTIKIVSKEEPENLDIPDLSNLNDFYLLNQWSGTETSIEIINWKTEKTIIFSKSYRFQPKTTGRLRIEALTIRANGQIFTTDPVFITVKKENKNKAPTPSPKSSPLTPPSPFHPPPSLFDIFKDPFSNENAKNDVQFPLNLSKQSAYKTEMIRADWFILQSSGSIRYTAHKIPDLKGFWKEEIQDKRSRSFTGTQIIDNVLYRKKTIDSLWLFPLQAGQLTIDPFTIRIVNMLSFASTGTLLSSSQQTITVKNLPSQGLNDSFTGAVGLFTVQGSIQDQSAEVNQPLSYKITFEGLGHPRFISLPPLPFPPSVQTYPPVEKSSFSDLGQGKKEFEILIVPKQKGTLKTPEWTLSTFDPQQEKYIYHKIPSFSLFVKESKSGNKTRGETFFEEKEEKEDKKQASIVEPLNTFYWPAFIKHKKLIKLWLALFAFLLTGLIFLYIKNFSFKKEKTLKEKVNKKISVIQELLQKKNWQKACAHMLHTNNFVIEAVQIKGSSSGWRQALDKLPPSLNKKYFSQFENLFQELENLSFSQKTFSEKEALEKTQSLFKQTKTLIDSFLFDL